MEMDEVAHLTPSRVDGAGHLYLLRVVGRRQSNQGQAVGVVEYCRGAENSLVIFHKVRMPDGVGWNDLSWLSLLERDTIEAPHFSMRFPEIEHVVAGGIAVDHRHSAVILADPVNEATPPAFAQQDHLFRVEPARVGTD